MIDSGTGFGTLAPNPNRTAIGANTDYVRITLGNVSKNLITKFIIFTKKIFF